MSKQIIKSSSRLYLRDLYTVSDIDYAISKNIVEYDMRDAGFNLLKYYALISDADIERLTALPKHPRKVEIGNMQRRDKKLASDLSNAFMLMRKKFFRENEINDSDVLAIKKDAIFIVDKKCTVRKFGNVEFHDKHTYTSYHRFGNVEMYYNSENNTLDIKGINDDELTAHEDYMISLLKHIFSLLEEGNRKKTVKFFKDLIYLYKNRMLDAGYYRELNPSSRFTFIENVNSSKYYIYGFNEVPDAEVDFININYNYINYIHPMIQRHYFIDI